MFVFVLPAAQYATQITHEKEKCRESLGDLKPVIFFIPHPPKLQPSSTNFCPTAENKAMTHARTHAHTKTVTLIYTHSFPFFPCNTNITPRLALIMRSNLLALLCMALAMMAHGLPTPDGDDNQAVDNSEHVAIPHVRIGKVS